MMPKRDMRSIFIRARSFFERLPELALHVALVALVAHVNEVAQDQPAEVAQPDLPADLRRPPGG